MEYWAHHQLAKVTPSQWASWALRGYREGDPDKAPESKLDPDMALLCLWDTPIDSALSSPGLLKGWKLHNDLPPKICNNDPSRDDVR